jgi:hypothetical protein
VAELILKVRQSTQRGTDSQGSGAWLTVQTYTPLGNQIPPYLWRIRHKFGHCWGQVGRRVARDRTKPRHELSADARSASCREVNSTVPKNPSDINRLA